MLSKGRYVPVTFQVLSAKNSYESVTPQDKNDTPYLFNEELIEVVNIEGNIVITFPLGSQLHKVQDKTSHS